MKKKSEEKMKEQNKNKQRQDKEGLLMHNGKYEIKKETEIKKEKRRRE